MTGSMPVPPHSDKLAKPMKRAVLLSILLAAAIYPQARKYTLPPPNPAGQVANAAKVVPQPAGKNLIVPAGFTAVEYASGFQKPRDMVQLPGGTVLVTETVAKGGVYLVNNEKARKPLIEGLDRPFGMAFHDGYLYVSEAESITRFASPAARSLWNCNRRPVAAIHAARSCARYIASKVVRYDQRLGKPIV